MAKATTTIVLELGDREAKVLSSILFHTVPFDSSEVGAVAATLYELLPDDDEIQLTYDDSIGYFKQTDTEESE